VPSLVMLRASRVSRFGELRVTQQDEMALGAFVLAAPTISGGFDGGDGLLGCRFCRDSLSITCDGTSRYNRDCCRIAGVDQMLSFRR
jgi:hypothetical protein